MSNPSNLPSLIISKVAEQVDRAEHLLDLIPPDKIEWRPLPESLRLCEVLGHLLECLAGFCASLYAVNPKPLAHFLKLRELPVNHCCKVEEAGKRMHQDLNCIREGLALVNDDELARPIPTVFVPGGEPLMTILLGNLEHFVNHKYQLFFYLKLLDVAVNTDDLYKLR